MQQSWTLRAQLSFSRLLVRSIASNSFSSMASLACTRILACLMPTYLVGFPRNLNRVLVEEAPELICTQAALVDLVVVNARNSSSTSQ